MAFSTAARNLARNALSVLAARAIMREFRPHVIFATGGYVSAPVVLAGALAKIPSILYLPDLEPGWAIRFSARWAKRVAVTFEEVKRFFPGEQAVVTGYPVRIGFFRTNREQARARFGMALDERVVTILGGSRGARALNAAVAQNLRELARIARLIWITGTDDAAWVTAEVKSAGLQNRARVFDYLDEDLPPALAAADLVVARAGASALGEFPALGLPAILVPYPYAGRHQESNANFLARRSAAVKLDNAGLGEQIVPTVKRLLDAPAELERMSRAMRALSTPDAAARIARVVAEVVE